MSNRFVRSTKYRHVFGTPYKKDKCYDGIRVTKTPWESNMCAVNGKFLAVVLESQGGGAFLVCPLEKTGRFDINYPKVSGHQGNVLDLAWNPFDENQIASCSEDCTIMIWNIPDGGLTANMSDPVYKLEGHQKKVGLIEWHPTAEDIIASAGNDCCVMIWNIKEAEPVHVIELPDLPYSLSWNDDGSHLCVTAKDKKLRIIDPRNEQVVQEGTCHEGTKPTKCAFLDKYIFTTGFSRSNERQYALWNLKDLSKPLTTENIDSSSGVQNVFYDEGTRMVYLVGKGDSQIRYYEITDEAPYVHFLNMHIGKDPFRGAGCLPKRYLNFRECEVMRFYILKTKGIIEPVVMTVPRKSSMFQEDIYPPCFSGQSSLTAEDWLGGQNKKRKMQNITKDGLGATTGGGASTSSLKVSGPSSGQISKQSSVSSSASEPSATLKIERENSPISLTASGDFDDSAYRKEIESLREELEAMKQENANLKQQLKQKASIISEIKQLVK